MEENYDVIIKSKLDDDTEIITSITELSMQWLQNAMASYDPSNQKYSTYLKDDERYGHCHHRHLCPDYIDFLADNAQSHLEKILEINDIIRLEINKDGIIGKTYDSITSNINTQTKISYDMDVKGRNKIKQLDLVKDFVSEFNSAINLKYFIRTSIPTTFAEGTYICYLRHDNNKYKIDFYPLGVCEISDYDIDGDPVVLFNVAELRSRLRKIYRKNNKNVAKFFDNMEEEVKANYPDEVYQAFINKEKYAKLDIRYTGVIRINNMNKKYGLSPIFRAFRDLMMLDTFDNADRVNSQAKAKKIIHQKLRKEVMGKEYDRQGFEEMAYSHQNLMSAWQMPTVLVTTPAFVESIEYIEPTIELTDTTTVNNYRSRILAALGISFLMDSSSQSVSTASISVEQLLRTINVISEQVETVIEKWYKQVLSDNGLQVEYCPDISIIDAEMLDFDTRKDLATTLYTIFNGSMTTSLEMMGIDINDEKTRRERENLEKLDITFAPRATAYTSSGLGDNTPDPNADQGGRPTGDDINTMDKQAYDKERLDAM